MIQSNYKFKETNGRLSLADDLKDRSDPSSFKCYNKFVGFFLKLFGKAQDFEARDTNGTVKKWVVNKNSFNRWQKALPNGIDMDSKIESLIRSVKDEQSRVQSKKTEEENSSELDSSQLIRDRLSLEKNQKENFLEEKTSHSDHGSDEPFQETMGQKSIEENEDVIEVNTQAKDKSEILKNRALAFAEADEDFQINETLYLNLINHRILGGWNFKNDPLHFIDAVKSDGRPSAIKAYEFFTNPGELEILEAYKIISPEVKNKLLRRVLLEEQVRTFADTHPKNGIDEDAYFHTVNQFLEKITFDKLPSHIDLYEIIKKQGPTGELAFEFLTNPEELEDLVKTDIISNSVRQQLLKFNQQPYTSIYQALSFASSRRNQNFNEAYYLTIIQNLLDNFSFQEMPFVFLKDLKNSSRIGSAENKMIYEFFTNPEELDKLVQGKAITSTLKNMLLNPPRESVQTSSTEETQSISTPETTLAENKRKSLEDIALAFANAGQHPFNKAAYLRRINVEIVSDKSFETDPLVVIEAILDGGDEEARLAYEFFTTSSELEKLEQAQIISTEVKEKLLKRAILKENSLAFARSKTASFDEKLFMGLVTDKILTHAQFQNKPLEVLEAYSQENNEGKIAAEFFTTPSELEKLEQAQIISTKVKEKLLKPE